MNLQQKNPIKGVVKKTVKKKTSNPVDDYKKMVDPATGKKGTMGGEGINSPFTKKERKKMPRVGSMGTAKNGKKVVANKPKMKKAMMGASMMDKPMMKMGGKMTKCKYGCK